jgi:aminoglycoside 6'-N-acetyltransferase I
VPLVGNEDDAQPVPVLRPASISDLADLVRLTRAFYDEDGFTTSSDDIRVRLERFLATSDARISVATDANVPYAFALTTIQLVLESGLVAELQDLFVDPAHRRSGTANALIEDAASWAQLKSASLLEVVVAPNGREIDHLIRYYTARHFTDQGRRLLSRVL